MKSLVAALALLVLVVAEAHHTPQHQLGYPKFVQKKTHLYEVYINMTSGVPGMHSQVAKSVLNMELKIYAKSPSELIISMHKVRVSGSQSGVESKTDYVPLKPYPELEAKLKIPIKAILEEGRVKSYTLDPKETLESKKIKKTILRNLEVYLDKKVLHGGHGGVWPLTYSINRTTPLGNYQSHYIVTSSPNPAFPKEKNVFNISRTDNYEVIPYLAYQTHHNFQQQGCPEVCKKNHVENRFGAGCPSGFEPYNTPMKKSFVQHHNLKTVRTGDTIIDSIRTKETHVADVYDQNMEVTIRTLIKFKTTSSETIKEETGQVTKTDLSDMSSEINEKEIREKCKQPDPRESIEAVKSILNKITFVVLEGNVENEKSKLVGEQLILLQKALTILKQGDLRTIQRTIVNYDDLPKASENDKVKRQIWLDNLPVIGTSESISFIVQLIKENMNKPNKAISLWESKNILESLPNNILYPSGKTVVELSTLLELIKDHKTVGYHMFYSAAHVTVSRVVRNLCAVSSGIPTDELPHREPSEDEPTDDDHTPEFVQRRCPKTIAKKFIQDIAQKLKTTTSKTHRVIYIETLARTGLHQVLSILRPYVYGQISGFTPSYTDYIRTLTIHTLHNLVGKHPKDVEDIVLPVFHNKTESPKVRNAAFAVFARGHPTLGALQHVAEESWKEPSAEVGSFVTSTLETLGNSTIPCHQLTAQRIKKILPLIKRIHIGKQHAKNLYWSLFDQIRGFGLESRLEQTPSNESFFPNTIYGSLGYNADSLRDFFFQYALLSQGLTSRNVWDPLLKSLGIKPAEDIPKEKESEIFPDMDIIPRDPEPWRFTVYEKLFYSTSYYYFDAEESDRDEVISMIKEQMSHYFRRNSQGGIEGHLVKVYIPSSYRSKAIGLALTYPVEFEMRNPLVISLKLKVNQTPTPGFGIGYTADISPSVYYSTLYTNQMLNLGDCKHVGVYHEKRFAATYPVRIRFAVERNGKSRVSYSFPELPKKIFSYKSEAGTYAGKTTLEVLPPVENRRTIKTLPAQFVKTTIFGMVGLPRFERTVHTENIQEDHEEIPRTPTEAIHQSIKHFLNAGWRRKSIEISRVPDTLIWPSHKTQVHINFDISREYVSVAQKSSEGDWSKGLKFEDSLDEKDTKAYAKESETIHNTLTRTLDHISHKVNVKVEQVNDKGHTSKTASFLVNYRHTLGGFLHFFYVNATARISKAMKPFGVTGYYTLAFTKRPNEFKYDEKKYGQQVGLAIGGISFNKDVLHDDLDIVAKATFGYESLDKILKKEMYPSVSSEHFLPETHTECVRDVSEGKGQSVACVKAMREHSIYNKLRIHAIWGAMHFPSFVKDVANKLDIAMKHAFYPHISEVEKKTYNFGIHLQANYIDKMTDKPVVDILLVKPTETIKYKRISAGWVLPVSSIDNVLNTYVHKYTNNTYPATCAFMDKYVRTYDMKTFRMPRLLPEHTYILSTHCTNLKKFAVLVDYDSQKIGTKRVQIHLGTHTIVLVPSHSKHEYKVKYDDKEHVVRIGHPIMFNEEDIIYALVHKVNDGSSIVEIHAVKAGVKMVYDGKNVKQQVETRYKGELCGLCSEFNGEKVHELRGVNRCLYSRSVDFAKSNIIGDTDDKKPAFETDCKFDEITFASHEDMNHESYEPITKRNKVLTTEDELCFSVSPQPVCENNEEPRETKRKEVEFHCLPKSDTNARKLVAESRRRILGEMETKRVDRKEWVEVAKMC